jgi:hypothetical protein
MSYSRRETVVLNAVLRGEGHEKICRVSAVKVTDPTAPAYPAYTLPAGIHSDDDFPDGNYEVIISGDHTFRFIKRNGEYMGSP